MGRGIDETCVWGKKICGPDVVVPLICKDSFITVDELVQVS